MATRFANHTKGLNHTQNTALGKMLSIAVRLAQPGLCQFAVIAISAKTNPKNGTTDIGQASNAIALRMGETKGRNNLPSSAGLYEFMLLPGGGGRNFEEHEEQTTNDRVLVDKGTT